MYAADTIAAIATPPGMGGIGIVRVSGTLAAQIAERVFSTNHEGDWQSHRLYHGKVLDHRKEPLDDALAVLMRAPCSYTGEDVLEIHCHGSPVTLRRVLASVLSQGGRPAEPGEFTRRAFLNGRLDLAQAEAVIELIRARTDAGADMATAQLLGRLSQQLTEIRDRLIDIRAQLEVQIDFTEEEIAIDPEALAENVGSTLGAIERLLASYGHGKLVRQGVRVPIAGKPNVGKSSLFNALLNEERAIVAAIPGTTRDVVEESTDFDGVPVVLSDTAGLRVPADFVEEIGVKRAQATVGAGDVVLVVFDGSKPLDDEDEALITSLVGHPMVAALNKCDLLAVLEPTQPPVSKEHLRGRLGGTPVVSTSALRGSGLAELRAALLDVITPTSERNGSEPTVTLDRHRDALEKAAGSLRLALDGAKQRIAPDLLAVDVQSAADYLGSILGVITTDDVLDRIFSQFCIGK